MNVITLPVVEIFESIQGEGIHTGAPATFVRLAGCNLSCPFCDTDFKNFQPMSLESIESVVCSQKNKLVVITGGEPLIHKCDLMTLVSLLMNNGFIIELETNGTIAIPHILDAVVDFVSLSPKVRRDQIAVKWCSSLKILFPYLPAITAESFASFPAVEYFIQPIDENLRGIDSLFDSKRNTRAAMVEVKRLGYPWRLGCQVHKLLGLR